MKRVVVMYVMFLSAVLGTAQQLNTSAMSNSGQSGASEESRYVLGLVKNGRADLLNKYFDQAPWKIQTEIDVYKNAAKEAAVSVFCVAVDLGNVDVVKAFVNHGLGPADLCRVQKFTTKTVAVSKADRLVKDTKSTRSEGDIHSEASVSWFKSKASYSQGASTSTTSTHEEEYHQVAYAEKKVVKTYFANPLDFASDEMFDYLWSQGFRSNNLFTVQALADAKATGKREVYDYILANKPEVLGTKPSYISEATYAQLLKAAKENPDSLATELLMRQTLGKVKTSKETRATQQKVDNLMQANLASQVADTVGYSAVMRDLTVKEEELKKKEDELKKQEDTRKKVIKKIATNALTENEVRSLLTRFWRGNASELLSEMTGGSKKNVPISDMYVDSSYSRLKVYKQDVHDDYHSYCDALYVFTYSADKNVVRVRRIESLDYGYSWCLHREEVKELKAKVIKKDGLKPISFARN